MNWKTAIKIYMSKTHSKNGHPFTMTDLITVSALGIVFVPLFIIMFPFQVYKIKKEGIKKRFKKNYLYYKKEAK